MSKTNPQPEIDIATLANLESLCDPKSLSIHTRAPFRLRLLQGLWTVGMMPPSRVVVAIHAPLPAKETVQATFRFGRLVSHALKSAQVYAQTPANLDELRAEWQEAAQNSRLIRVEGISFAPQMLLAAVDAVGAPEARINVGHMMWQGFTTDAASGRSSLVYVIQGTLARVEWVALVAAEEVAHV